MRLGATRMYTTNIKKIRVVIHRETFDSGCGALTCTISRQFSLKLVGLRRVSVTKQVLRSIDI